MIVMDTLETNSKTNLKAVLLAQTPLSKNINGTGSHTVQKTPRVVAVPLVRFSYHSEECVRNGGHGLLEKVVVAERRIFISECNRLPVITNPIRPHRIHKIQAAGGSSCTNTMLTGTQMLTICSLYLQFLLFKFQRIIKYSSKKEIQLGAFTLSHH